MAETAGPGLTYRRASPPGTGRYEVFEGQRAIGSVGHLSLSAGQFGSRWVATTPAGTRSGSHHSRAAAAAWLVQQAAATEPS